MEDSEEFPGLAAQAAEEPEPNTLLEQLAAKRKEISETKETFIPVPGYDRQPPLLLVRYRLIDGPELVRIGEKVRREVKDRWQRQLITAVDTMIASCVGIYVDQGDGAPPEPLTYHGEPITGFNQELAEALQYDNELSDPPTARSVVFKLFVNNDAALSKHNWMLNRWYSDPTLDIVDEMEMAEGNL